VLADAFGSVEVRLRSAEPLTPGDLVTVTGAAARGRVTDAVVSERFPCPAPTGSGEVARLAWHGVGPRLAARAAALDEIRRVFSEAGFVEVDTPVRVRTPGLDLHVDALRAEGGYLSTSPELQMKRLLVGGVPRCFQLSRCFRKGELGRLHEPEFTMLEWYRAFAGQAEVMADTEAVVTRVVQRLAGGSRLRVAGGPTVEVRAPFERVTVREAFRRFAKVADAVDLAATDEDRFFELLVGVVEPALARRRRPVFLCEYPATQASLARRKPGDPAVAERFELYLGGVELSNGFGELTDPAEQRARFQADRRARRRNRRPVYALDERFLAALHEGMPPAGGNALGVDRLIALALGQDAIALVMPFPWDRV
jgi:lysyl-tRNA synthetase class 2